MRGTSLPLPPLALTDDERKHNLNRRRLAMSYRFAEQMLRAGVVPPNDVALHAINITDGLLERIGWEDWRDTGFKAKRRKL